MSESSESSSESEGTVSELNRRLSELPTTAARDCEGCKLNTADFRLVAVPTGYEDLKPEDRPKWRHINASNLQVVGKLPKVCDLADEVGSHDPPSGRSRRRSRR